MLIDFQIPGPPFSQYFTSEFNGPEILSPGEKVLIERAVEQRVKHFSTGRFCAKQALGEAGLKDAEILKGPDKEPVWPQGIVGSISHSKNLAGAVVAHTNQVVSIGLDIETIGGVKPEMWDMLFLPSEQKLLNAYRGDELAWFTTILFSAKESFYKFQFPITKTFLDFTDVELSLVNEHFILKVNKEFPQKALLPDVTPIYFVKYNNQVITLCFLLK